MGVWTRCLDCGEGIQRYDYSAQDAERDYYECPECQCKNPVDLTLAELIDNLTERVTELEANSCYSEAKAKELESHQHHPTLQLTVGYWDMFKRIGRLPTIEQLRENEE